MYSEHSPLDDILYLYGVTLLSHIVEGSLQIAFETHEPSLQSSLHNKKSVRGIYIMQKHVLTKQKTSSPRSIRFRLPLLLTAIAFVLIVFSVFFTFISHPDLSSKMSSQKQVLVATTDTQLSASVTPVPTSGHTNITATPQVPTKTPVKVVPTETPVNSVAATPTLIPSTPQQAQLGVFPLSSGGPLPIPESVLRPTNIARVMLNNTIVSVYAGSMTQNAQAGILCVLREDLTSGQLQIQMYQDPKPEGALTILSVQNSILKITDSKTSGTFDLSTNQFHW